MIRDALRISVERCRPLWRVTLAALAVAAVASVFGWRASAATREVQGERLARESRIRQQRLEASARKARVDAERELVQRLEHSQLDESALDAVASVRRALVDAGASGVAVDAGAPRTAGGVEVVTIRVRGQLSYRALRAFLAACDARDVPLGWERLSFDGTVLSAELHVLARSKT